MCPLKFIVLVTLTTRLEALPPSSPNFLKTVKEAIQPILDAAGQYYQVQMILCFKFTILFTVFVCAFFPVSLFCLSLCGHV